MDGHGPALSAVRLPGLARAGRGAAAVLPVAVPAAFLAIFFAYPVASIVGRGLLEEGRPDLGAVADVLTDPALRHVAWFTLWQAVASTVLTLAIALPGAFVLSRYRFRGRAAVRALVTVPFVLPTVVVGSAFRGLLGPRGPLGGLGLDETVWAILLAHVFFNYAVVVRTVGGLWAHLDPRQEEAARVLGASRTRAFLEVTLPALRPAIAAAASIVFLFTFTSFGVILVLGGPRYATLEVEIFRQTAVFLDLRTAAVLALLQMAAVTAALVWLGRSQRRRARALSLRPVAETTRRALGWRARSLLGVNLAVMALLLGAPLAVLVERSLSPPGGWGLGFYRALTEVRRGSVLFVPPTEAIRNSLAFATVATTVALVVGGLAAAAITRRDRGPIARSLDTALMLPLGTSAVTIGFGFLIALDQPPLDLRTSVLLVPLAHALVAIPFVVRTMVPVLRSLDPRLREAAAVMGASPSRVWREVDLPIVARAMLVAAGFAFAVSLGEFGATAFIARPDHPTLPVVIFRLLGQPGALSFGQAMAASTVLMALTATSVLVIERFRIGEVGEF